MRAVAGGLDHAPKIKWRKNQKALARANGTFRRASGWAGEKVARSGSRSSQPSREWVSVNRECGLFVCPTTTVSHRSKQAEQANVLLQDLTPFCLELMKGMVKSERVAPVRFSEWALTYLDLPEVTALRTFQDRYESVQYQLIPFFGSKLLGDITPGDIEAFRIQRRLRNGDLPSMATVNADHAFVKHMLSIAERRGLLTSNAAKRVPMQDPKNERDRVLSSEEWDRLHAAAADHIQPVLLMAYQLGPRLGEILNLTWDRVDLHRGFIKLRSVDTKTKEPREIPITPMSSSHYGSCLRCVGLTCPYVFQFNGGAIKRIKRAFHTAVRKAGIENLRFHDLRHCAATNLRRAGVDTVTAMKIVGHKSEKMHRRYNSVSDGDLSTAARKLNSYLSNTVLTPATNPLASVSLSA